MVDLVRAKMGRQMNDYIRVTLNSTRMIQKLSKALKQQESDLLIGLGEVTRRGWPISSDEPSGLWLRMPSK